LISLIKEKHIKVLEKKQKTVKILIGYVERGE
jgi:phenylpyruvate tautomerase PptA (4-oxalocrotonate tautomerase family)